jgi:hypothetical protein
VVEHGCGDRDWGLFGDWQGNGEGGAGARLGEDLDLAAGLGQDAVDGGLAQAGARAVLLGGEERLEDVSRTSGGMPTPVSLIRSRTFLPCRAREPPATAAASTAMLLVSMVRVPPPGIASRALEMPLRASSASQPNSRTMSRQTSWEHECQG